MEYRRRKRRRFARPGQRGASSGGAGAKVIVVLLLAAVVVYLISASAVGTWIAENIFAPVFAQIDEWFSDAPTPPGEGITQGDPSMTMGPAEGGSPVSSGPTITSDIEFPAMECYAVQMGVFNDQNNAEMQAQTLMQRGAGGYIMEDAGRYRVLAAAFALEENLRQVRDQLETDGLESAAFVFSAPSSTLRITAGEGQVAAIENAFSTLRELQGKILDTSLAFDQDQQTPAQGREAAASLLTELRSAKSAFESAAVADNEVLRAIAECFNVYEESLYALSQDLSENFVDFSSKIKYTNISMMHAYYLLADKIMQFT